MHIEISICLTVWIIVYSYCTPPTLELLHLGHRPLTSSEADLKSILKVDIDVCSRFYIYIFSILINSSCIRKSLYVLVYVQGLRIIGAPSIHLGERAYLPILYRLNSGEGERRALPKNFKIFYREI